jgi:two-component system nitrogen regulation sensor histidine kinase NtrY
MTMRDKGTGLGLPIVKKIIEEHGGHLEIHDAPPDFDHGFGAMFRVILPLADQATDRLDEKVSAHGV